VRDCHEREPLTSTPITIGPYDVLRPIAQGGMAEVFEVRDRASGERMALKLLIETKSSEKRFNREFEAMTRLNHPGIVRVYRYGYHGEQPWITMELLEGEPLQGRVKAFGPPGEERRTHEVVRIGYFLANALQYIHDRGLVHRDLKSANVQVLPDGRVKVIDFGTAHLANPLERITQDGDFVGTFSYAAPEQIVGGRVDHRADLYSLGVLMYRLLTGRRPFKATEPKEIAQLHLSTVPKSPREVVPELPEALDRLIMWLMAKKRGDRPQTADEVASALEDIAGKPLTLPGHGISIEAHKPVGREEEQIKLWAAFEDQTPASGVVVVGGDCQERLGFVGQVARDASKRGWRAVVCAPGEQSLRAIAAFYRAVVDASETPAAREVRGLLLEPRGILPSSMRAVLEQSTPFVARTIAAYDKPTMLVIEEAPSLGADGAAVVQLLIAATIQERAPLVIAATGAHEGDSSLAALVRVMNRPLVLELGPLDAAQTALAVGALVHRRPPPPEAARRIHEDAHGQPTLIRALVSEMVESGRLAVRSDDGNRVEWTGAPGGMELPPEVREELDARLGELPAFGRRVLEVLYVAGGAASVPMMAAVLEWQVEQVDLLVDALREEGWLCGSGLLSTQERMVLAEVGRTMSPARMRVVQEKIVDLVPRSPPTRQVVDLLLAAGRSEEALDAGTACAQALLDAGETGAAVRLLERLRPIAGHPGLPKQLRGKFQLLYGRAVRAVRPMDPASVRALNVADSLADNEASKASVKFAFAELQGAIGHYVNYRRYLDEAWQMLGDHVSTSLGAEIALQIGGSKLQQGMLPAAESWYRRALQAARSVDDPRAIGQARLGLAWLVAARGDIAGAVAEFDDVAKANVGPRADLVTRWRAVAGLADMWRMMGRYSDALTLLHDTVVEARGGPSPPTYARLLLSLATSELELYRLGRAQEVVDELLSTMAQGERLHLRLETRLLQGRIQLASGQLGPANYLLHEVVEQADLAGLVMLAGLGRAFHAETRWALGEQREALELYKAALVSLAEVGDKRALIEVVLSRARAFAGREEPSRGFYLVRDLLEGVDLQPLQIEALLARYRYHQRQNQPEEASRQLELAAEAIRALAERLDPIEQAAMRVHPWTREVQRGAQ
jgi:tetratricopeptide (TPR) repeat protein